MLTQLYSNWNYILNFILFDVSEFIQNEIKQKLNLHKKKEFQTCIDKKNNSHT